MHPPPPPHPPFPPFPPQAQDTVARLLERDIDLGAVRWVAPSGLFGLTPLAGVGPVAVGGGPVEGSSATVAEVVVGVDPLRSISQARIVLTVKARGAQVGAELCV
jgi:hypothetical protein